MSSHSRRTTGPTIGLCWINAYACAEPEGAAQIAALAERLGYDSVWAAEHVVLPSPRVEPSPMDPEDPILDPVVALAHVAAHTERIRLGTGIVILPQRNPLVLAKQLASLDVVTGGRLLFGMGVGYLEPEMRAIGVPMADRAARSVEYLEAMRSLWQDEAPAYHGRYVDFEGVDAHPRPVQRPIPVVMGGHSAAAHRRAALYADEWYGFRIGLEAMAEQRSSLRQAVEQAGRAERPLPLSVTPSRRLDKDVVSAYAELGVDRLIVLTPLRLPLDELARFVEENAPARVGGTEV